MVDCFECKFASYQGDRSIECHRYAPKPLVSTGENFSPDVLWPVVYEDDSYCGEGILKEGIKDGK